jgi:hypothetical protein
LKTPAEKSAFFFTLQEFPDLSGFENLTGLIVLLLQKLDSVAPLIQQVFCFIDYAF